MTKRTWHIRAAGLTLAASTALSLTLSGNAFAQEDSVVEPGNPSVSTSAEKDNHLENSALREETIPTGTAVDPDKYKLKKWPPLEGVEFAPNPEIKKRGCNDKSLNIAFVYDISGSVGKEGAKEYKNSTKKIIDSIAGKNIGVASFYMRGESENPQPEPKVVTKKNKDSITENINKYINPSGHEDWGAVLEDVDKNNKKYKYDLVIFIADGNPVFGPDDGRVVANKIKKSGTRIVTVGAGPYLLKDVDKSLSNLVQLSGPKKNSDWFLGDWDKLTENLLKITERAACVSSSPKPKPKPIQPSSSTTEETATPTTPSSSSTTPTVSPSTVSTTVDNTITDTVTETNSVSEVETETSTETEKSVETNTETIKKTETVKPAPETTTSSSIETQVIDKPYPVQQPAQPVYGPKVETGGEVDNLGLLAKIKAVLFR